MIVSRSQTSGSNRRFLRNLPIVITNDDGTAAIVQFQNRILQSVWHTEAGQGRAHSANQHLLRVSSGNDKAANADLRTGLNQEPGGNVHQGGVGRRLLNTQSEVLRRIRGNSIARSDGKTVAKIAIGVGCAT